MEVKNLRPLNDKILVTDLEFGNFVSSGGIIFLDDEGKEHGVRPRYAKVFKVGKNIDFVKEGQWILLDHGRWSRTVTVELDGVTTKMWQADPDGIMGVTDETPDIVKHTKKSI